MKERKRIKSERMKGRSEKREKGGKEEKERKGKKKRGRKKMGERTIYKNHSIAQKVLPCGPSMPNFKS